MSPDLSSNGCSVETPDTPERCPSLRRHYQSPPTAGFGRDVRGRSHGVYNKSPRCEPTESSGYSTCHVVHVLNHQQLCDVALGLNYLHFCNVIHGSLKGVSQPSGSHPMIVLTSTQHNIHVDPTGCARITNIGVDMVAQNLAPIQSVPGGYHHNVNWAAPEILEITGTYSKEVDVFSFAGVMIEVRHSQTACSRHLEKRPNVPSAQHRFSPVPHRSAVVRLTRQCWQSSVAIARHAQPIRS